MLRDTGEGAIGSGWTLKPCDTEQSAIDFAISRAKEGMVIQAVGEMGDEVAPKYRHDQIVALMKDA